MYLVEAVNKLPCAVNFRQVRNTSNKRRVVECLLAADDLWAWMAYNLFRYKSPAKIGVTFGSWDEDM